MRIVVDAMGSDAHPVPDIDGAVQAANEFGDEIILVGDEQIIKPELAKHNTPLEIIHAPDVITMKDKPSQVGRGKPNSSIHVGTGLVRDGQAEAFVSVGNTGAILAISTLQTLKRIPGVTRPALTTMIVLAGRPIVLVDIGANADSKPDLLLQFAIMGSIYAENALKLQNPRVALLSNGEEEGKGNELIRESAERLANSPLNFVGNAEPKEVLGGEVDVMVADGFVGNIFIKTMEAFGATLFEILNIQLRADARSSVGGLLARPALRRVYKEVDPFEVGGAPLLGVNGVVIIGHGRTNALGMKNAIRQARRAVEGQIVDAIKEQLGNK